MIVSKQLLNLPVNFNDDIKVLPTYKLIEYLGFVQFMGAGLPATNPIGQLILNNIENIVKEAIKKEGFYESSFPSLIDKDLFRTSGRDNKFCNEIFYLNSTNYVLCSSIEELYLKYVHKYLYSYKQLPTFIFSLDKRFRNTFTKRGINRLREFELAEIVGFHQNLSEAKESLTHFEGLFRQIFSNLSIKNVVKCVIPNKNQILFLHKSPEGEHELFFCEKEHVVEMHDVKDGKLCSLCGSPVLKQKAFGMGMFYIYDTDLVRAFDVFFDGKLRKKELVTLSSYSIGLMRLFYGVIDEHRTAQGLSLPNNIAPFQVSLLTPMGLCLKEETETMSFYNILRENKIQCMYDDRANVPVTTKKICSDYLGIKHKIVMRRDLEGTVEFDLEEHFQEKTLSKGINSILSILKSI